MLQRSTPLTTARGALLMVLFITAVGAALTLGSDEGTTLFTPRAPGPAPERGGEAASHTAPTASTPTSAAPARPPRTQQPLATVPDTILPFLPPESRSFVLTPNSGPNNTQVIARGTGCAGSRAGVSLELLDPTGRQYTSDGAVSLPDGTWWASFVFTAEAPTNYLGGDYKVRATCRIDTNVLFEYETLTFTLFR